MTNVLWACAFVLACIGFYRYALPWLRRFDDANVARIAQQELMDGVSLYMTFRQFGASLGVAVLTILIERRETLHSSRLYDHLTAANCLALSGRVAASA